MVEDGGPEMSQVAPKDSLALGSPSTADVGQVTSREGGLLAPGTGPLAAPEPHQPISTSAPTAPPEAAETVAPCYPSRHRKPVIRFKPGAN